MSAIKIAHEDARETETPNASMTTLASPTQGGTGALSLWRTTMRPGQSGPLHTFDAEQVWHVLDGAAMVLVDTESVELSVGDTLVLPAGSPRQVRSESGVSFVVCGSASSQATPVGGQAVSPPWIV